MSYLGRSPAIGRYAKLDDIASSFNGSTTTFNLASGGDAQVVQTETQLLVSLGGIIQEPQTDYTVSGSTISFTTAPISGDDYFAILLGDTFNVGVPSDNTLQNRHVKSDAAIAMSKLDGSSGTLSALTVDNVIINGTNIGHTSDTDAIAIASNGVVTMNQIPVLSAGLNVSGGTIAGTLSTAAQGNITSLGTLTGLTVNGATVFNENSADVDFRIESNGNANMLFVDGGNDRVGIGTATPASLLEVKAATLNRSNGIALRGSGANDILYMYPSADNAATIEHLIDGSTTSGGVLLINPQGGNVGIGLAAPAYPLDVYGVLGIKEGESLTWKGNAQLSAAIVGHGSSAYLSFWTSANERMRIIADGKVGIGTTAPLSALHVAGGIDGSPATAGVHLGMSGNYAAAEFSGTDGGFIDFQDATDGSDHDGRIIYTHSTNAMIFSTAGAQRFHILGDGKVAINKTSSTEFLEVHGAIGSSHSAANFGAGDARANLDFATGAGGTRIGSVNGNYGIAFLANSGEKGRFLTDGKFGISTSAAEARLHVIGEASGLNDGTIALFEGNNDGGNRGIHIGQEGSGSQAWTFIQSYHSQAVTNYWELLLNPYGGNVGIGTTDPSELLHLNGSNCGIRLEEPGGYDWRINNDGGNLNFSSDDPSAWSDKMTLTNNGTVLVGTTTNIAANAKIFALGASVGVAIGYGTGNAEYRHAYMNSGDAALYFWGTSNYANLSSAGAWTNASDRRIKKNIVDIKYGLEDVLKMQPRSFQMKEVEGDYIGLIAQEVEEIIPEVVGGDPEKQLTLDYGSLVSVAFKAIQELEARIKVLEG